MWDGSGQPANAGPGPRLPPQSCWSWYPFSSWPGPELGEYVSFRAGEVILLVLGTNFLISHCRCMGVKKMYRKFKSKWAIRVNMQSFKHFHYEIILSKKRLDFSTTIFIKKTSKNAPTFSRFKNIKLLRKNSLNSITKSPHKKSANRILKKTQANL